MHTRRLQFPFFSALLATAALTSVVHAAPAQSAHVQLPRLSVSSKTHTVREDLAARYEQLARTLRRPRRRISSGTRTKAVMTTKVVEEEEEEEEQDTGSFPTPSPEPREEAPRYHVDHEKQHEEQDGDGRGQVRGGQLDALAMVRAGDLEGLAIWISATRARAWSAAVVALGALLMYALAIVEATEALWRIVKRRWRGDSRSAAGGDRNWTVDGGGDRKRGWGT